MMTQAQVSELAVDDKRARKRFIALERELMDGHPLYVPELGGELDKRLAGRSAFSEEIERALLVASNGRDIARCAALINRSWQRSHSDDVGFVGHFAAAPGADAAVAKLLGAAEQWLAQRGVTRVIGPYSGDALHGFATQVDAFDEQPVFPLPWQPPHYPGLFEAAGYRPAYPFWVYEIDLASERYRSVSRAAIEDARCTVRTFDKKRWDEDVETLRRLQNETFRDEWEFHDLGTAEYAEFMAYYKPVFDERQVLFAEVDGEPVGMCFGQPDWSPLFRSFNGRMGPVQIARYLLQARRFDRAGLLMIGVLDVHRGKHIGQTLAATLFRHYEDRGLQRAYYYPVNEHNRASRALAESFGGRGRNLYTVYEKDLHATPHTEGIR